jgi:hypothetical protein
MTLQTASQIALLVGLIFAAFGGFGSYYFGKRELDVTRTELTTKINELQANTSQINERTELIFQALKVKAETWIDIEMKNVPGGVADYLLLLFKSDKGRISGKVRIKGSEDIASFSTTVNNKVPVAVRNLWLPKEEQYKIPTIMQFSVTEKTDPNASLQIYTQGWIDTRGREPH